MNAGLPPNRAHVVTQPSSLSSRLDRAYRLYRRRIGRCRTENQLNRIHLALENFLTPAEVRYLRAALAREPPDSPGRPWIARLDRFMPVNKPRPVEFERSGLFKSLTRYTAGTVFPEQKTLIIGFSGHFHRLMLPMPWLLDCLDPRLYDVLVLRDFSRRSFTVGVPELGADFFAAIARLRELVRPHAYRNAIALGTSSGGTPALLAAILLGLKRGISVSGQDFQRFTTRVKNRGLDDTPYAALLASRPEPFPDLLVVCGAEHTNDVKAASALHELVPSHLWKIHNCEQHAVLPWQLAQGRLPAFLAEMLDQSLESSDPVATTAVAPDGQRY